MRSFTKWLVVPVVLVAAAACGGGDKPADDSLKNDLALASQMQPYQAQQFMSPTEAGLTGNGYQSPQPYGAQGGYSPQVSQPVYYPQPRPRATVRRVPASTRGRASRDAGVYQPAPRREPIRHTKRDAAIGAVAGGVLGAAVSRDRVKGAVIGAVAGGVLGGIIGHTIDVKHPQ
jgi:hypothetical protein